MDSATKGPAVGIEDLLSGMTLLAFLQELAAIGEEELVDALPPINEGERVVGEMSLFERRLNHWFDRKAEEIVAWGEEMRISICPACKVCGTPSSAAAPCADLFKLSDYVSDRFHTYMTDSIGDRFPCLCCGIAFRRGFLIVTNVREESAPRVVNLGNVSDLTEVFGSLADRMTVKKYHRSAMPSFYEARPCVGLFCLSEPMLYTFCINHGNATEDNRIMRSGGRL